MTVDFHVVIPARYASSRLPGKLMMDLQGMTVIERVYLQALKSQAKSITIATDHDELYMHAQTFGANVLMTDVSHQSGTDRIAQVVEEKGFADDDIIVNIQGDEPFLAPELVQQVAETLASSDAPMATLYWPIQDESLRDNSNVVKVVLDANDYALYFSRSAIPANRNNPGAMSLMNRHIGIYAYRAGFLKELVKQPVCELEATEALEQLRVLWLGYKIKAAKAKVAPLQDINTKEDLEQANNLLK